jgi:hypothetical protein
LGFEGAAAGFAEGGFVFDLKKPRPSFDGSHLISDGIKEVLHFVQGDNI